MDIGHSFGIDDDFFDDIKIQDVFKKHFQKVEFPDDRDAYYKQERFDDYQFPIGRGVKIHLDEFNLNSAIIEEAIKNANEYYQEESDLNLLIEDIKKIRIEEQSLIFFATGHLIYRTEFLIPDSYTKRIGAITTCCYHSLDPDDKWFYDRLNKFKEDLLDLTTKNELPTLTKRKTSFSGSDYCFLIVDEDVDISTISEKISSDFAPFHAKIDAWGAELNFGYVISVFQSLLSGKTRKYLLSPDDMPLCKRILLVLKKQAPFINQRVKEGRLERSAAPSSL